MSRGRNPLRRALALAAACTPLPAAAHLPTSGLGPAYDGILHLLLSPEDLIPLIALALLCGQRGASFARRVLWVVPLAWLAGGVTGMFVVTTHAAALAVCPSCCSGDSWR